MGSVSAPDGSALLSSSVRAGDEDVECRLQLLEQGHVEFSLVQVYRQPVSAVADHHLLVYWYSSAGVKGVQVDWGQNGLSFSDRLQAPDGAVVRSKECGLAPGTLAGQVRHVRARCYSLVQWNCQHFCQHLFERACGNARLNEELDRLQHSGTVFDASAIYQKTPGSVDEWVIAYWYASIDESRCGLQLQWDIEGLQIDAVTCEPGTVVRSRECRLEPRRLRRVLRETEGWPFDAQKWNCQCFAEHFFDRVLAQGGAPRLREHLDELAARGAEIAGVWDVIIADSDEHALVYKYRATGDRVVHLRLGFNRRGLEFTESEELPVSVKLVRTKPMLFVRLQPDELARQVLDIESRPFDAQSWNSQHVVNHLFDQIPGKSRAAKDPCDALARARAKERARSSKATAGI